MDMIPHQYEPLFGSWYIKRKLDQGTSGQLYQIYKRDPSGHELCSVLKMVTIPSGGKSEIKSILSSGLSADQLKNYFQNELSNALNEFYIPARLDDKTHIVCCEEYDIIKHHNYPGWDILLRMEKVTPLIQYVQNTRFEEKHVLKMGMDICRGLDLLSRHRIIHRDIKPENISLSNTGDFKIGDFGIACIVKDGQPLLSRRGTYSFMAPEMFHGNQYTENVDVYSLGLVMYRYLNNGRDPFIPASPGVIASDDMESAFTRRISGHDLPAPANGSRQLKKIVLKACAYSTADRYATASEMLRDLEALANKEHPVIEFSKHLLNR